MSPRAKICCVAAALALAAAVPYLQTGGFGFLRFDDPDYTFRCSFVQGGLSWANVCEAFRSVRHGAVWMPLTWLSYMLDVSLLGGGPGACHIVNALLHAANVALLLLLVLELGAARGSTPDMWWLALPVVFWALHPQRVEAVAWIASRKELMWSLFALLGLIAWLRGRWIVALALCACACMSKPTGMVFPLLAWTLDRLAGRQCRVLRYLPLLLMGAATGLLAVYSQTHPEGMATKDLFYAGLPERLLNAAVALGLYAFQTVVPIDLHIDYRAVPGGWPVDGALGLTVFLVTVLCLAALARCVRGCRIALLWSIVWFFAALLPTLGLFGSFGEHARADRFLYVPAMALPIMCATLAYGSGRIMRAPALLLLALFAVQTFRIASSYRDDLTAFSRALACDPGHGRAMAHVGEARCAAGALDEGIDLLRRSREVRPRDATDGKLAYALMRRGRSADWEEIRAVCAPYAADPSRDVKGQALEALGTAELKARAWQDAAGHLARSITAPGRFYSSADAKLKLAFAWHNGGRRADARSLFEAVSRSSRADLAARADQVLAALDASPNAILFW